MVLLTLSLFAVAPAVAPAQGGLTPEQFAAVDRTLSSFIALEERSASAAAFAASRAACRAIASADPLLGPYRQACTASVKAAASASASADCVGRAVCLRRVRRTRLEMTNFIARVRAFDAVLGASSLPTGCKQTLRSSKAQLRLFGRQRDFWGLLERAIKTRSPTLFRRVDREGIALDRLAADQPSAKRERKNFRAACAPAPA